MGVPDEPVIFMKAADTVQGPDDTVVIPRGSEKTDYEVELAVVIGRTSAYLDSPTDAARHILGYAISDDVSERHFQLERGGQWDKGKNCATFNPLGPWIATADEIADPQALELTLSVNGEVGPATLHHRGHDLPGRPHRGRAPGDTRRVSGATVAPATAHGACAGRWPRSTTCSRRS